MEISIDELLAQYDRRIANMFRELTQLSAVNEKMARHIIELENPVAETPDSRPKV